MGGNVFSNPRSSVFRSKPDQCSRIHFGKGKKRRVISGRRGRKGGNRFKRCYALEIHLRDVCIRAISTMRWPRFPCDYRLYRGRKVGRGGRGEVGNVRGSIERSSSLLTGFGPVDNTGGYRREALVPHFHIFLAFF